MSIKDIPLQPAGINNVDDVYVELESGSDVYVTSNNIQATSNDVRRYKILVILLTALIIVVAAIGTIIAAFRFEHQQQNINVAKPLNDVNILDCTDVYNNGGRRSGIYKVYPVDDRNVVHIIQVYCDMKTAGGGWTTFQRRLDGSVNFTRTATEYKAGFGNLNGEYWLGNEILSIMTNMPNSKFILRVHLQSFDCKNAYAEYVNFSIGTAYENYRLHVGPYNGTMDGCGLCCLDGKDFSTYDLSTRNHSRSYGGFWFREITEACVNLNGYYYRYPELGIPRQGIMWYDLGKYSSLKSTIMMFKRVRIQ